MQVVPLIGQAAALADELDGMFDQLAGDGEVCAADIDQLDPLIDQVKLVSNQADLAYQWGMAVLKAGIEGKRAKELENENFRFEPLDAA